MFVSDVQCHSTSGGRVFGLAALSAYLPPSKAISQRARHGSQLLHCLVLHQLTMSPSPYGLGRRACSRALGKGREGQREKYERVKGGE